MQLVIAVKNISRNAEFMEKLDSYKYRNEVFLCDRLHAEDEVKLLSAAYALIYLHEDGSPATHILNAFKARVPVIAARSDEMSEIAGDAVAYVPMTDHAAIADQIMLFYKDEMLLHALRNKGEARLMQRVALQPVTALLNELLHEAEGSAE